MTEYIVATERLGWPHRRRWSLFNLIDVQRQLVYEDEPSRPTATCHLQTADDAAASGHECDEEPAPDDGGRGASRHQRWSQALARGAPARSRYRERDPGNEQR